MEKETSTENQEDSQEGTNGIPKVQGAPVGSLLKATKVVKLLSGVEAEFSRLKGKHQRLLTQGADTQSGSGVNECLADCLVRLGNKTNVTPNDVKRMLSGDRKKLLVELRFFSVPPDQDGIHSFPFMFQYKDDNGTQKEKQEDVPIRLSDFDETLYPNQMSEYPSEVITATTTLPGTGQEVIWNLLTGLEEEKTLKISKRNISTHTPISMREPKFTKIGTKEALISVDLDNLDIMDIEHLRGEMKKAEGEIDTVMGINNPDTGAIVQIDITSAPAFFFPSGAL